MKILSCLVSTLLLVTAGAASAKDTLNISSIDWCPQLCDNQSQPGYVMDTVNAIFADSPYNLETRIYPWSRAILNVESGQSHALLSPAKEEAPNLLFPKNEIGLQRMCFFTRSDTNWTYDGLDSLSGKKIGVANDTSIEELNSYMQQHKSQFDFLPYNENYIVTSFKKLKAKRIDAFVFTYNSTVYEMNQQGWQDNFRPAGCVSSAKIYMAFTPAIGKQVEVEEMMEYFDKKMEEMKQSGQLDTIMQRYGLENWQNFL